jgi:hypothetical protein
MSNAAEAGGSRSAPVKVSKASQTASGWAMDASSRYGNNLVHRYHGGPKYPH